MKEQIQKEIERKLKEMEAVKDAPEYRELSLAIESLIMSYVRLHNIDK